MLKPLRGVVRRYEWGSRTAIPDLLGLPADGDPWAELWLGAHPSAPARVGPEPLDRLIASDPEAALGPETAARFGRLPFLAKVLAAARPLSLQAHPSAEQARAGFEREQALGIPLDSPRRSFRDRSHKPELVCALSEFEALCGLRDPAASLALLDAVDTAALDPVRERLRGDPSHGGLRRLIGWLLRLDRGEAAALVNPVARACARRADAAAMGRPAAGSGPARAERGGARGGEPRHEGPLAAAASLGARHPGDPGVIAALLLNHAVLAPGEALFVASGTLHCYLRGAAVEVMACSDNVLRGGLTAKHVDVDALLEILDAPPGPVAVQPTKKDGGVTAYDSPSAEFCLRRIEVEPRRPATVGGGPAVLLCTDGSARANALALERGQSAWADGAEASIRLTGRATVFHVGAGRASQPTHRRSTP